MEQMEIRDIYEQLPEVRLALNTKVFDFGIAVDSRERFHLVWSEYSPDTEEVKIYSRVFHENEWEPPILVYEGQNRSPDVNITVAHDDKIHLLLTGAKGLVYELGFKTYNGTSWGPETTIVEVETSTFGHNIAASHRTNEIYVVYGDYNERHYFPYILTAIFTGHTSKEFGKLFLIQGNGMFWIDPIRITKRGRFSCTNPKICLCDKESVLNIAWEDERNGYWTREVYYDSFSQKEFSGNRRVSENRNEGHSPLITCDDENNVYLLWNSSKNEELNVLWYRERIDNIWSESLKLPDRGIANSIGVDNLRNVHIMWANEDRIFLKMKIDSVWSDAIIFDGMNAKSFVDTANNIHILQLNFRNEKQSVFTYRKFVWKGTV